MAGMRWPSSRRQARSGRALGKASLSADRSALGFGLASLSADRATCFPRDRASCPHARRSAPASLPQDGPHRRGSPTEHRARDRAAPVGHGDRRRRTGRVAIAQRSLIADGRERQPRCGWPESAVRRLRSGTRSRRRPRPHGPRRQARSRWRACRRIGPPAFRAIGHPALTRGARLLPRCRRTALTAAARPPSIALATAPRPWAMGIAGGA
jgi:hypothetical protein